MSLRRVASPLLLRPRVRACSRMRSDSEGIARWYASLTRQYIMRAHYFN